MILHILAIAILSLSAGWLYRAGGSGYYPFYFREAGMMICEVLALLSLGYVHLSLIFVAGATYGVQTTYFKKKGTDANLWNWILVGLAFSVAVLPLVAFKGLWIGFAIRTLVLTSSVALWSQFIGKDWLEEGGRGALQILTLPLLLI